MVARAAERGAGREPVRLAPALGVETRRARGERGTQVGADVGGEHREVVGARERRVREVHDAQVGPLGAQLSGDEGQLEVLHEHDVVRGGRLHDRVGEALVHRHECIPRVAEPQVEPRSAGVVEHPVVQEPQHAVGDDVVVHPVLFVIEVEQPYLQLEAGRDARFVRLRSRRPTSPPRSTSPRDCR